ncbi:MAG: hypothetical protein J6R81_01955, partial [Alistipes sp.]|nr:hypothetical protein [Alistipes sp.]
LKEAAVPLIYTIHPKPLLIKGGAFLYIIQVIKLSLKSRLFAATHIYISTNPPFDQWRLIV